MAYLHRLRDRFRRAGFVILTCDEWNRIMSIADDFAALHAQLDSKADKAALTALASQVANAQPADLSDLKASVADLQSREGSIEQGLDSFAQPAPAVDPTPPAVDTTSSAAGADTLQASA